MSQEKGKSPSNLGDTIPIWVAVKRFTQPLNDINDALQHGVNKLPELLSLALQHNACQSTHLPKPQQSVAALQALAEMFTSLMPTPQDQPVQEWSPSLGEVSLMLQGVTLNKSLGDFIACLDDMVALDLEKCLPDDPLLLRFCHIFYVMLTELRKPHVFKAGSGSIKISLYDYFRPSVVDIASGGLKGGVASWVVGGLKKAVGASDHRKLLNPDDLGQKLKTLYKNIEKGFQYCVSDVGEQIAKNNLQKAEQLLLKADLLCEDAKIISECLASASQAVDRLATFPYEGCLSPELIQVKTTNIQNFQQRLNHCWGQYNRVERTLIKGAADPVLIPVRASLNQVRSSQHHITQPRLVVMQFEAIRDYQNEVADKKIKLQDLIDKLPGLVETATAKLQKLLQAPEDVCESLEQLIYERKNVRESKQDNKVWPGFKRHCVPVKKHFAHSRSLAVAHDVLMLCGIYDGLSLPEDEKIRERLVQLINDNSIHKLEPVQMTARVVEKFVLAQLDLFLEERAVLQKTQEDVEACMTLCQLAMDAIVELEKALENQILLNDQKAAVGQALQDVDALIAEINTLLIKVVRTLVKLFVDEQEKWPKCLQPLVMAEQLQTSLKNKGEDLQPFFYGGYRPDSVDDDAQLMKVMNEKKAQATQQVFDEITTQKQAIVERCGELLKKRGLFSYDSAEDKLSALINKTSVPGPRCAG